MFSYSWLGLKKDKKVDNLMIPTVYPVAEGGDFGTQVALLHSYDETPD